MPRAKPRRETTKRQTSIVSTARLCTRLARNGGWASAYPVHDAVVAGVALVSADFDAEAPPEAHRIVGLCQAREVEVQRLRDLLLAHARKAVVDHELAREVDAPASAHASRSVAAAHSAVSAPPVSATPCRQRDRAVLSESRIDISAKNRRRNTSMSAPELSQTRGLKCDTEGRETHRRVSMRRRPDWLMVGAR
eukprot:3403218-Rhodomonas_salina.3